jgi:hypothetical protein
VRFQDVLIGQPVNLSMKETLLITLVALLFTFCKTSTVRKLVLTSSSNSNFSPSNPNPLISHDDYLFTQDGHTISQINKKHFTLRRNHTFEQNERISCFQIHTPFVFVDASSTGGPCKSHLYDSYYFHLRGSRNSDESCPRSCFKSGEFLYKIAGNNFDKFSLETGKQVERINGADANDQIMDIMSHDNLMYYYTRRSILKVFDTRTLPKFDSYQIKVGGDPKILKITEDFIYTAHHEKTSSNDHNIYVQRVDRKDPKNQTTAFIRKFVSPQFKNIQVPLEFITLNGKNVLAISYIECKNSICVKEKTDFHEFDVKSFQLKEIIESIDHAISGGIHEKENLYYFAHSSKKGEKVYENSILEVDFQ